VALQLDDALRGALGRVIGDLREADPYVRWVKPENLHITLKFLGNMDAENIPAVKSALGACAGEVRAFALDVAGIDVIPNPRYPRVVYAGLEGDLDRMKSLTAGIENAMAELGFKREERDFLPHLTLGRVKSFKAKSRLMMKIREYQNREIGRLEAGSVFLMKSELHPKGAIYTTLAEIKLR